MRLFDKKPASSQTPAAAPGLREQALIHPKAVLAIQSLELRAKVVVEGFWNGLHRSPYHGFSVEFTEYRQYVQGDDTRYLDWRLYGRSDRYYIKKFEDETNLRCHFLVDKSRSMKFGSLGYSKGEYANSIAATLAYFLTLQSDAVGLLTFDSQMLEFLPARYRPGHLRQFLLQLEKPAEGKETNLERPLDKILQLVTRRGMVVIISDMLAPLENLGTHLGRIRAAGHEATLFHIVDPAELEFSFKQTALFLDLESGKQLYIDAAAAKKDYLRKVTAHHQEVKKLSEGLGIGYHLLRTDRPLELSLLDFVRDRQQRGKSVARTRRG